MTVTRRRFLQNVANVAAASAAAAGACGLSVSRTEAGQPVIRPPGALPETEFLATCLRCMRCVDACPNQAIKSVSAEPGQCNAGTPYIKPREQACMLCSGVDADYLRCSAACPSGALQPIRKDFDAVRKHVCMGIARIDLNLCYSYNDYTCGTCYHACPMGAIAIGLWERPRIREDVCIGCGLCERACIRYPQAVRIVPVERTQHGNQTEPSGSDAGGNTT